jgi:hypothetical protein
MSVEPSLVQSDFAYRYSLIWKSHFLLIPIYFFPCPFRVEVKLYFTMTLEYQTENPLYYELSIDGSAPAKTRLPAYEPAYLPTGWEDAVSDNVWTRTHSFSNICQGSHTVTYRPLAPGLLLERIILDLGGVQCSYLGPLPR